VTAPALSGFVLPNRVKFAMFVRLLALQGSWNYQTLLGTGIGFVMEPALRYLPGGVRGAQYRAALARESRYFNAHPYLAGIAVGSLTRAELEGVDPARIERFRSALAGPLGSVGDRLVWASWLPLFDAATSFPSSVTAATLPSMTSGAAASLRIARA